MTRLKKWETFLRFKFTSDGSQQHVRHVFRPPAYFDYFSVAAPLFHLIDASQLLNVNGDDTRVTEACSIGLHVDICLFLTDCYKLFKTLQYPCQWPTFLVEMLLNKNLRIGLDWLGLSLPIDQFGIGADTPCFEPRRSFVRHAHASILSCEWVRDVYRVKRKRRTLTFGA